MASSDDQEPTPGGPESDDAQSDPRPADSPRPDDEPSSGPAADATNEPAPDEPAHPELAALTEEIHAENEAVRRRWRLRPTLRIVARIVVAIVGVLIGILIGGHTTADIGPITVAADLQVGGGATTLRIPPLGSLEVQAYDGPISLQMTVLQVDQQKAAAYINGAKSLTEITDTVENDLRSALIILVVKTALGAIAGGILLSLLLFRRWRDGFIAAGTSIALIVATGAIGYATFDAKALQQPKYNGLLEQAPAIVGNVGNLADKFADYRKALVKLVTNVSTLYTTISTLPVDEDIADTIKVLHVSDIHMNPSAFDLIQNLVKQFKVDFVIDTGDLVDWGTPQESMTFSTIGAIEVPYVYIRGNHDSMTTQAQVAAYSNAIVLDKSETTVDGITIAGIGDPRFSPDRTTYNETTLDAAVKKATTDFADYLDTLPSKPDVLLIHDPAAADLLKDDAPLILSGHRHKRQVKALDKNTLLMVQGSTGGAGLRGLEGDEPTPMSASVLYFDATTQQLRAWDDITVGGLGQTDVSIKRTLAPKAIEEAEESASSMTSSEPSDESSRRDENSTEPSGTTSPSQPVTTGAPPGPGG